MVHLTALNRDSGDELPSRAPPKNATPIILCYPERLEEAVLWEPSQPRALMRLGKSRCGAEYYHAVLTEVPT